MNDSSGSLTHAVPDTDTTVHQARIAVALEAFLLAGESDRRTQADTLLRLPGARDAVIARLRELPAAHLAARSTLWRLAIFDGIGALLRRDDGWLETTLQWLEGGQATWQESANVCAEIGFQAHLIDHPDPITVERIRTAGPTTILGRGLLHLHLISMRLAYRWEAMEQCITELGHPLEELDPYSRAYHTFALLAQGHPDALAEMERLLAVAGDDYRVHLSLVEGLRLSRNIPGQGQLMLDLLERPALRQSASPDPLYRKAFALRKLGRYDDALRAVDECLQKISPLQVRDRIRIVQERDLILAEQAIAEQAEAATAAAQQQMKAATSQLEALVARHLEDVRRSTSEVLFRVVEILGVFTAIIALLGVSAASVVVGGLTWWQRGLLIAVAAAATIGFFLTLRAIVQPSRRSWRSANQRDNAPS